MARRHVEERSSYRVLAKRCHETLGVKLGAMTVQRLVMQVACRCKTPAEMSRELGLEWRGYLIADDKHISLRGKDAVWYVAVDRGGDIPHIARIRESSVTEGIEFFRVLRDELHYPMKGLTTDEEAAFRYSYARVYPGKPHQICIKHVLDGIDRRIGYTAKRGDLERWKRRTREVFRSTADRRRQGSSERSWQEITRGLERIRQLKASLGPIERLRKAIRRILCSRTYEIALGRWAAFQRHPDRGHEARRIMREVISRKWGSLTVHHRHPGMPRTNNDAESVMRQLEQRLKTIGSFGSDRTMGPYMNLLVAYLRMKPYTDCRGRRRHRNGLSRIELAGGNTSKSDWLKMALKR